jgi:peptidoglycan/xylan/chitin deacetylase (PgdA/CDA1 family)
VVSLRRIALRAVARSPLPSLFGGFTRGAAPIFMLHRFADPDLGVPGHDPQAFRRSLAWLRRSGYRVVPVAQLVRELAENPAAVRRTLALTIDDGYDDFRRIGWPIAAEFDCPVTVFLTTGFLDGTMWFWWDRVELAFATMGTARREFTLEMGEGIRPRVVSWSDAASRQTTLDRLVEDLKEIPQEARLSALDQIFQQASVAVPDAPPPAFVPMAWDDVRRLEGRGVAFGAHSVTHPILSRTTAVQAEREIRESWERVRAETAAPVPVFCYPNGRPGQDFTAREVNLVERLGFKSALASHHGYATGAHFGAAGPQWRYALPRYAWSDEHADLVQVVSGMERVRSNLLQRWQGREINPLVRQG